MSTTRPGSGRLAALAATAVCGCLLVWALALVFADLAMSRPRAALAGWESGRGLGDVEHRRRLLERMGRAVAVNPADADQRMDLGRFFAWHAARYPRGSQRHRFYASLAASRFEEAVAARPTWGFAWMLLAEQMAQIDADEGAVIAAMRRGSALGPQEPRSQLKHLWLALGRWQALDAGHRQMLVEALSRLLASRTYFNDTARIVLHHDRMDLLSGAAREAWQVQALATLQRGAGS